MTFLGRRVYLSNLLRFRMWLFALLGPALVAGFAATIWAPLAYVVYFPMLALVVWHYLTTQMACRHCQKPLAVTRVAGQPEVCSHCGNLTDKGVTEAAAIGVSKPE